MIKDFNMKKYLILVLVAFGTMMNLQARHNQNNDEIVIKEIVTDDYKKISSSELTPAVVEEILKQYPTSKLGAAYRNSKGDFKLIMVLKSGTRRTVFIDPYGNWIIKKKK